MTAKPAEIRLEIQRLENGEGLPLPAYESAQAAGMDLAAAIPEDAPVKIAPGERSLIATGFAIALPQGFEAQIRPRSGLAFKHGVTVLNAPGTIDADYRGELKVLLINHGGEPFTVRRSMRIAQMVIQPAPQAVLCEVEALGASERGSGGFGSTGTG